MIITKSVEVKISKINIDYFLCYYKDIELKDIIQVDPNNLQKSSSIKIDVSCNVCGVVRNIRYQAYRKNINSCEEYPIYTCDKCSHIKIKSFNRKKWGVDYFSQTDEYNDKFKSTMMKRYGVEHALQSEELKDKVKKTNLEKFGFINPFMDSERIRGIFNEKYGVDHPSQVEEFRDKINNTNMERYGVESPLESKVIRDKIKKTNLERYNNENIGSVDVFRLKRKNTNLERYGVESPLESKEIRDKIKKTNLERYGVENPIISDQVRSNTIIGKDPNYIKYLGENISLFKCDNGHEFGINIDNYHGRSKQNLPLRTICYPISNSRSIKEDGLLKFISLVYSGEIIQSYRDGLEIDIYLPELKIGFEFNGLYWHSAEYKEKNYHLKKTNFFRERGIRVIHIWEDDWSLKNDIIKSQISNWIGNSEKKIYARKCKVIEIKDTSIIKSFLNVNHIQGYVHSIKRYGLFYKGELVSLMTFDKLEGRKKMSEGEWNLNRFCNKLNISVIGGASKIFNHFINDVLPSRIISYADVDWSVGNLYHKLGFNKISESNPDYKYLVDNKRAHKSRYKKSRLDTDLSESAFMKENGIHKIYDCGKLKFELIIKKSSI